VSGAAGVVAAACANGCDGGEMTVLEVIAIVLFMPAMVVVAACYFWIEEKIKTMVKKR